MAELTAQDRLQPSLLDRLTDRAPYKERAELRPSEAALASAGMNVTQLQRLIQAHGFSLLDERADGGESVQIYESQPGGRSLRQLLAHTFRPRREAPEVVVSELVTVLRRWHIPNATESRHERVLSGKQLKECVIRDLGWLLNTGNLASVEPLDGFQRIRASVLNYGIPELSGVTASGADLEAVAAGIAEAIETFEPRLRQVHVAPADTPGAVGNTLSFVIEAELWGQPSAQHLLLHTELDLESAAASVHEANGVS